jgi:predicted phage tail protein
MLEERLGQYYAPNIIPISQSDHASSMCGSAEMIAVIKIKLTRLNRQKMNEKLYQSARFGQLEKKTVGKETAKQASDKIWIHKCRFVPSVRIIKARTL